MCNKVLLGDSTNGRPEALPKPRADPFKHPEVQARQALWLFDSAEAFYCRPCLPPACQGLCLPVQAEPDEEAEEASRMCRDVRTHKLGVGTSLSLRNCLYSLKTIQYLYMYVLLNCKHCKPSRQGWC